MSAKKYLTITILLILINTVLFHVLYTKIKTDQRHMVYDNLKDNSILLSTSINTSKLLSLIETNGRDGDREYLDAIKDIKKTHLNITTTSIRYVYTVHLRAGKYKFGLDTADYVDADGDGKVDHSNFGSDYSDAPDELKESYKSGHIVISQKPYTDSYGTFISSFVPLIIDGRVVSVLGVDVRYDIFLDRVDFYRNTILVIYLLVVLFIILGQIELYKHQKNALEETRRNHLLREEMRNKDLIIIHESKMIEVGKLVAFTSHEINNPMAIIMASVKMLSRQTRDENLLRYCRKITDAGNRVISNISNMKNIAKKDSGVIESFRIKDLAERVVGYTGTKIPIFLNMTDEDCVRANKGQIEQVFLNLFNNSIEAIKEASINNPESSGGGKITVSTRISGKNLVIVFSDSGPGIPEETWSKISAGFFTSKDGGTGVGLLIVKKIIALNGGDFQYLQNEPTTTFEFTLPLSEKFIMAA